MLELPELGISLKPGELVALVGPVGSGKTTTLEAICGLRKVLPSGKQVGPRTLDGVDITSLKPHQTADLIGYVHQNPSDGFVAETVIDELAFGCEQLGYSNAQIFERLVSAMRLLRIEHLALREVSELSGGEQQLVAVASALVTGQRYLLLDEPTARLDANNSAAVLDLLRELAHQQKFGVLITEHDAKQMKKRVDRVIELKTSPDAKISKSKRIRSKANNSALRFTDFDIEQGEIVAITGRNAVGKTRLLNQIYEQALPKNCVMVPQHAADLLIFDTVRRELSDADATAEVEPGTAAKRLAELGFDFDLDAHPRDLSAGQQLALVLAIQLVRPTELLLLDEPNRSLDPATLQTLSAALIDLANKGTAIVLVSHDSQFIRATADRVLLLQDGRLEQVKA